MTFKDDGVNARISPDGRTLAFSAASATGSVSFWVRPLDSLVADEERQETGHRWPCFLPDGKHFIFVTLPAKQGMFDVFVGSIDAKERTFLFAASSAPVYAEPEYLIYMRDNTLVAHRFDAGGLAMKGRSRESWRGASAVRLDGRTGRVGFERRRARPMGLGTPQHVAAVVRPCREGRRRGSRARRALRGGAAGPDGKRLAAVRRSGVSAADIWLFDLERPVPSRFTFGPSINHFPAWSPDGSRIAFASDRFGPEDIFVKSVNGAAEETAVLKGGAIFKEPTSWSADGKSILFDQPDPKTGWDLYLLSADGASPPVPFLHASGLERYGVISPDGRWIAYYSDEAGRMELLVQSFPAPGAKYQVSNGGANDATTRWTRGGKELMFMAADGLTVMSAEVATGASFHAGDPRALFKLRADFVGVDFSPDGERIMASTPVGRLQSPLITLEMNWPSLLRSQTPTQD